MSKYLLFEKSRRAFSSLISLLSDGLEENIHYHGKFFQKIQKNEKLEFENFCNHHVKF